MEADECVCHETDISHELFGRCVHIVNRIPVLFIGEGIKTLFMFFSLVKKKKKMKVKEKTKIVYSMKALCGGAWPAMLCREGGHTCMAWQATPCHTHAKKKKYLLFVF